jgi:hypothetical protein
MYLLIMAGWEWIRALKKGSDEMWKGECERRRARAKTFEEHCVSAEAELCGWRISSVTFWIIGHTPPTLACSFWQHLFPLDFSVSYFLLDLFLSSSSLHLLSIYVSRKYLPTFSVGEFNTQSYIGDHNLSKDENCVINSLIKRHFCQKASLSPLNQCPQVNLTSFPQFSILLSRPTSVYWLTD